MTWRNSLSQSEAVAAFESVIDLDEGFSEETADTETTPETLEAEPNDPEEEEISEPEDDEEVLAADADADTPEIEEETEGEPEADISSLETLAEFFEVEPDEVLQNLEVEGPDGATVSIGEALDSWRSTEGLLGTRRQELEAQATEAAGQAATQVDGRLAELHAVTRGMIALMDTEYSDEKLMALRHSDPDGYVEAMDRRRSLADAIRGAAGEFNKEETSRGAQSAAESQKTLATENSKLLQAMPEWQDMNVRRKSMIAGQKVLAEIGFTQSEIDGVTDHRILLLVDKAVQGSRIQKGAADKSLTSLKKRGLKRPTPGREAKTRRDPENPNNKARAQAHARLRETGLANDAARLIEDMI